MWFSSKGLPGLVYTDRGDCNVNDLHSGNHTADSAYHLFDLSGVVGTGIKLLHLRLRVMAHSHSKSMAVRTPGNSNGYNNAVVYTQGDMYANENDVWVYCDVNGKIDVSVTSASWLNYTIVVRGWLS